MHDWSKVQLRSPQLDGLGPLSCADFHKMHWESLESLGHKPKDDVDPELEDGARKLMRCSDSDVRKVFLGVGLPQSAYDNVKFRNAHALTFFNQDLLTLVPNSKDKRVQAFDVNPCRPIGEIFAEPRLVPAMQSYPTMEPRFIPVASIEDCRPGGLTGTTH